jgi:hypothetical protein
MHLVPAQPVRAPELADLRQDLVLQRLKPAELVHPVGQALQVRDDPSSRASIEVGQYGRAAQLFE